MRKRIIHLFAGAAVVGTVIGTTPPAKIANVVVEQSGTAREIVDGSITNFWSRLTSHWKAAPVKPIQNPPAQTALKPKGN